MYSGRFCREYHFALALNRCERGQIKQLAASSVNCQDISTSLWGNHVWLKLKYLPLTRNWRQNIWGEGNKQMEYKFLESVEVLVKAEKLYPQQELCAVKKAFLWN